MDVSKYNQLCLEWHQNHRGQRLGQWLMNHLEGPVSDPEIYHCIDKKIAASLFFERHVKVGDNSPYKTTAINEY